MEKFSFDFIFGSLFLLFKKILSSIPRKYRQIILNNQKYIKSKYSYNLNILPLIIEKHDEISIYILTKSKKSFFLVQINP